MSLIENLKKRAAVKKYDPTKKLSEEQLGNLLAAIQLAPTSYGLQSFKVLVVQDEAIRVKLRAAAYDQPQITDASALIVFASLTVIDEGVAKKYIDLIANTRAVERENLAGFEQTIVGTLNSRTDEQKIAWSHKQNYIALGFLLAQAAELGIDATPMEGFDTAKFDEILGLKEKGLTTSVIAPVGFRADDDFYSQMEKVRKPKEELFIQL